MKHTGYTSLISLTLFVLRHFCLFLYSIVPLLPKTSILNIWFQYQDWFEVLQNHKKFVAQQPVYLPETYKTVGK